jgi:hypothetical protein
MDAALYVGEKVGLASIFNKSQSGERNKISDSSRLINQLCLRYRNNYIGFGGCRTKKET